MNKVVLVTGASRGIGRETALAFAQAGFDVAISARTLEDGQQHEHSLTGADGQSLPGSLASVAAEIRALGRQAWCIPMNLLDADSVLLAADLLLQQAGRIDVLVNNAGVPGQRPQPDVPAAKRGYPRAHVPAAIFWRRCCSLNG